MSDEYNYKSFLDEELRKEYELKGCEYIKEALVILKKEYESRGLIITPLPNDKSGLSLLIQELYQQGYKKEHIDWFLSLHGKSMNDVEIQHIVKTNTSSKQKKVIIINNEPYDLSSAGLRAIAFIIDNIIYFGIMFIFLHLNIGLGSWISPDEFNAVICITLFLFMFIYCTWKWGGSPGKIMFGMRVTTRLGNLSLIRISTREIIGFTISRILLIGYIIILLTEYKQGLHDLIAGTVVIDRK